MPFGVCLSTCTLTAVLHGRYTESAEVYKTLDDDDIDPAELAANRTAALCAAGDPATAEKIITATAQMVPLTTDLAYNRACAIIERGDWPAALNAINEVRDLPIFFMPHVCCTWQGKQAVTQSPVCAMCSAAEDIRWAPPWLI
jgi:hypothetical protein